MKSLYLILAATAVAVTCEPQRSNNDIIWYPVDDEEGVFISTVGEKHRSTPNSKWRSSRRPRYSGMERPLPLSYDPAENYDPSFFHNIHERRPLVPQIPKVPPSFQNQQFPVKRPNKRPQGQANQILNENFQEIFNEVFDYNKNPSENKYQEGNNQWDRQPSMGNQWGNNLGTANNDQWGGQSAMGNQWGSNLGTANSNQWGGQPALGNQWGSNLETANSNQWGGGQRPSNSNQWNRPSGSLANGFPGQRPSISNQWGSSSQPIQRPTNSEWFTSPTNTNRPNKRPTGFNRPIDQQSDKLIFPGETSAPGTTTPSNLIPTDPPTMSPCERVCPVTPEFNPVCGSDSMTYTNAGRLKCAQSCGKDVRLAHHGSCGRPPFITPLVSSMPKLKLKFW